MSSLFRPMSRIFSHPDSTSTPYAQLDLWMTESSSVARTDVQESTADVVVLGVGSDLVRAVLYSLPNLIGSPEQVSTRYAKPQQCRVHGCLSRTLAFQKLDVVLQSPKPSRGVAEEDYRDFIQSQEFLLNDPRLRMLETRVKSNEVALSLLVGPFFHAVIKSLIPN